MTNDSILFFVSILAILGLLVNCYSTILVMMFTEMLSMISVFLFVKMSALKSDSSIFLVILLMSACEACVNLSFLVVLSKKSFLMSCSPQF